MNGVRVAIRAGASEVREAEDLTRALFGIGDEFDVLLVQAEAVASLEAAVKALGFPGRPAMSVITSIYGRDMEAWFAASGAATVSIDLTGEARAATAEEVGRTLDRTPDVRALAVVQGEALTGLVNPIDQIAAVAAQRGIAVMIDSVSSVGAEPFTPQRWGRAISVLGAQKGLDGPAGVSVAVVEKSLWDDIAANPSAPRRSFLSLLDLKHNWLERGRTEFPGTPNSEELTVLIAALRVAEREGTATIEARHQAAKQLARETVRGIGSLSLTIADAEASGIATTFTLEDPELEADALLSQLSRANVTAIKPAPGVRSFRWVHAGEEAYADRVELAAASLTEAVTSGRSHGPATAALS